MSEIFDNKNNKSIFVFEIKSALMVTFLVCILALVLGYVFYGKFVDRFFGSDPSRK